MRTQAVESEVMVAAADEVANRLAKEAEVGLFDQDALHHFLSKRSQGTSPVPNEWQWKREWAQVVDINERFDNFPEVVPDMAREYTLELDVFQKQAVYHLEMGGSVFVAVHTLHTFGEDVGIPTGDVQIRPEVNCLIITIEILRLMLYRGADLIRDVKFVIFDEVHYVNDLESSTPKRPIQLEHFLCANELYKIVDAKKQWLIAKTFNITIATAERDMHFLDNQQMPSVTNGLSMDDAQGQSISVADPSSKLSSSGSGVSTQKNANLPKQTHWRPCQGTPSALSLARKDASRQPSTSPPNRQRLCRVGIPKRNRQRK
ncbi:hypothetical protein BC938DRAFT_472750 [Jimgerdemannia flammicorona]|uniref:Helicase ATP-binding domain-containing protein n=1 Tax=Jimgerdemannia flammicorona TaxID=994334 RepID=A0A433QTV8_9FUNG|nr:hypothetical protein BC938DRAFT_472750 [Jimgerdemannia flammicorona]